MQNDNKSNHHPKPKDIKIIIVGDISVGKSSIALRYSQDKFDKNI